MTSTLITNTTKVIYQLVSEISIFPYELLQVQYDTENMGSNIG